MTDEFYLSPSEAKRIEDGLAQRISDAFKFGDLDREGVWHEGVSIIAAEYYAEAYGAILNRMTAEVRDLQGRARQTEAEWYLRHQERERVATERQAELATVCPPRRKERKVNVVKFDVRATFERDADDALTYLLDRYGPAQGKKFQITNAQVSGTDLWLWITYGPLKGGEKSDVRRVLDTCAERTGNALTSPATITVLERTPVDGAA